MRFWRLVPANKWGGIMKWRKSKVPADKQSIDQVKNFGIQFPSDFRRIAIASHGTQPSPDTIDFGDLKQILFGCLLSFEKNSPIYIERVYRWVKDDLPDKVFPFAKDPFGNLYCFDYRDSEDPIIVYWYHESSNVTKVCDNFSDIEKMLYEPDQD
jgi:hypothetical protein